MDLLGDQIVDDPLTREAGSRGVESWQITPGAPPVRGAKPRQGRTLLRDATIHRNILKKARSTPTPAPVARRREAETARKPDGHEREFFKPAAPLLTNVVVDRPPPVRKAADPTWDPAPERVAAAPRESEPPALEPAVELDNAWFLSAEGTLEPALERVTVPPGRIVGFLAFGAALAALTLAAVAIGRGDAGSSAEAGSPSIASIVADAEPAAVAPVAEPIPEAAPVEDVVVVAPIEPVRPIVAPSVVPAREAPVKAPVRERPAGTSTAAPTTAMDRLRASMADNPMLEAKPVEEPAAPVKIPEGSAELWGEIETTQAPANPWAEIQ